MEIDRANNSNSAAKLAVARDAGAVTIWIRWHSGRAVPVPGTHLIDLISATRGLATSARTTHRPAYHLLRDFVTNSEFSEAKVDLTDDSREGIGSPSVGQIRYRVAGQLASKLTESSHGDGRLRDGLVVVGHQRTGDVSHDRADRIPGEQVRYQVDYVCIPGSIAAVRPLVLAP